MLKNVIREITPLTQNDCFTIFSRKKTEFDFPLHNHEDMELNLVLNASGAKRIVGDHIGEIDDMELVLVGSNLSHGWFNHNCTSKDIREVTIQFHKDLLDDKFLKRNQLAYIRNMFENAKRGVLFSRETIERIAPRLLGLSNINGFDSILELFSMLHDLSISRDSKLLSDATFTKEEFNYNSRRIEKVFEYMNANFNKLITLSEVAKIAHMPEASFSRFIKKRTGYTFIDSLNEIRLGHVSRMLIDTTQSVAEIAFKCGFNNMANFNRTFKSKKGCTPIEFRENYQGKRVFI
ncbi:AraC family transcriptional regulator [Pedobacter duraquae]|uniref:AraC-like DNA-binding protein n=1 Tax=Pedobacter duraquae TaxID=425511 RepID=A0A4R6IQJ3_9SPHI|nr:AraC family transcriptional regulator [Pedobacter duraquae]TDO24235.1 AraC-like DNA-binding protein [Pedobacter duraquae]